MRGERAEDDLAFRLLHIGMAVPELGPTTALMEEMFGYRVVAGPFADPIQRVRVTFLATNADDRAEMELIAPLGEESPIRRLLAKGGASGYHLCLETSDVERALERAEAMGCAVVSRPVPAVAFGGRRIAWLMTPTRQLFELVEAAGKKEGEKEEPVGDR